MDDDAREVRFTRAAAEQLRALRFSRADAKQMFDRLKEVAAIRHINRVTAPDVCRIAQTDYEWMRLKLPDLHPSTRVVFSIEDHGRVLLVRLILRRTAGTYDVVEMEWRVVA